MSSPRRIKPGEWRYGPWLIYYDPKPGPGPVHWSYVHDDYDGAPDANDNRCGVGADFASCLAAIKEEHE